MDARRRTLVKRTSSLSKETGAQSSQRENLKRERERKDKERRDSIRDEHERLRFKHNKRIALLMIPSLLFILLCLDKYVTALLGVSVVIVYLFHYLELQEGVLIALWVCYGVCCIVMNVIGVIPATNRSVLFRMSLNVFFSTHMLLLCVWVCLALEFVKNEMTEYLAIMERLIIVCVPLSSSMIITLFLCATVGVNASPVIACFNLFVGIRCTTVPMHSSYSINMTSVQKTQRDNKKLKGKTSVDIYLHEYEEITKDGVVNEKMSAIIVTTFHLLPVIFHVFLHSFSVFSLSGLLDLCALSLLPFLLTQTLAPPSLYWWTGLSHLTLTRARPVVIGVSVVVITGCFESRILLSSISSLLRYHNTSPSLSVLLVTLTLFSTLAAIGLYAAGFKRRTERVEDKQLVALRSRLYRGSLHVACGCSSVALGIPLVVIVLLQVVLGYHLYCWNRTLSMTTGFLAGERDNRYKRLVVHLVTMTVLTLPLFWIIKKQLWHLQLKFHSYVSVQMGCVCVGVLSLLAFSVPGLTTVWGSGFFGVALCIYVFGFAFMENTLITHGALQSAHYNGYYVIATSVIGVAVTHKLRESKLLDAVCNWVLMSLFIGKMYMLTASNDWELACAVGVVLCYSAVWVLYPSHKPPSRARGLLHIVSSVLSLFLARNTLVRNLYTMLLHPSPTSLNVFCLLLVLSAVSASAIVFVFFVHLRTWRRNCSVCLLLSLLLFVCQPDLVLSSSSSSSSSWFSLDGLSSLSILWTIGLLLVHFSKLYRLPITLIVTGTGTAVGLYASVSFVRPPPHWFIVTLIVLSSNCGAMSLTCLGYLFSFERVVVDKRRRGGGNTGQKTTHKQGNSLRYRRLLTIPFALFVVLLPVTYFAAEELITIDTRRRSSAALVASKVVILAVHVCYFLVLSVVCKLVKNTTTTRRSVGAASRATNSAIITIEAYVGNASCILSYLLTNYLWLGIHHKSEASLLVLCPCLLLLSADSFLFKGLTHARRYYWVVIAPSMCLSCLVVSRLLSPLLPYLFDKPPGWVLSNSLVHLGLFLCVIPILVVSTPSLWYKEKPDYITLMALTPLTIFALVFSTLPSLFYLASLGMVMGLVTTARCHYMHAN